MQYNAWCVGPHRPGDHIYHAYQASNKQATDRLSMSVPILSASRVHKNSA